MMSETHDQNQQQHKPTTSSSYSVFLKLLFSEPLKIFFQNKHIFLPIFLFLTLPLSFLLFWSSFSSRPLKRHIFHLESVALLSSTSFEARHILKESREESLALLRLKLLYSLPSSILSFLSFISTVHVTSLSPSQRPSFVSTTTAIKLAWKRVVVTFICSYAIFFLYIQVPQLLAAAFLNHPRLSLPILLIGGCFEVYLMGVLGLGLVVSALEDKFGWDALLLGSDLIGGRRVFWWWVTCTLVAVSGWAGNQFDKLTDGHDSFKWGIWTVVMRWQKLGLLCFYGVVIIWTFIVTTVFYCDCKNRLIIKDVNHTPNANGTDLTDFTL
ncbi:hypothetical protein PTKIN_Ptkin03bG0139200 [Pterospermum kingtungense]